MVLEEKGNDTHGHAAEDTADSDSERNGYLPTGFGDRSLGVAYMPQAKRLDWGTPRDLFDKLNGIFNFTCDVAASPENALCVNYFTEEDDALSRPWAGRCYCNPPYGRGLACWTDKAFMETLVKNAEVVVMLLPARTDTGWFHDCLDGGASMYLLKGRLKFANAKSSAVFASAICLFSHLNMSAEMKEISTVINGAWIR